MKGKGGQRIPFEPAISIIMPCFKGEAYIERSLRETEEALKAWRDNFEILVVVDGRVDQTWEIASRLSSEFGNIRVLGYQANRGKGYAVRQGLEKAAGRFAFMLDSDLDYDPRSLECFLTVAERTGADIVVGNRRDSRSVFVYPLARKVSSYIFNAYVNALFSTLNISDTQAGVKLLKTETVRRELLPRLERVPESDGFVFDVCLLVLARQLGLKIACAPCVFRMHSSTIGISKTFIRTSYTMWKDVLNFRFSTPSGEPSGRSVR